MKISIINPNEFKSEEAPQKMGLVSYKGRTYEKRGILKNYSIVNRIKKFMIYIIPTLATFGILLKTDKYKNKWSKIITGEFIQPKFMVAQDKLSIITQQLLQVIPPSIGMEKRRELQELLKINKINLDCQQAEVLEKKNEIDKEAIDAFLKKHNLPSNHPRTLLLNNIDLITFEELMNGLKICCSTLNNLIKDQPYAIGFARNKSQQWLAELALPYLNHAPISQFSVATDSLLDKSSQDLLDKDVSNFVIFDDASYSGNQINNTIRAFEQALTDKHMDQPCHLYLVVPFLSTQATELISSNFNWVNKSFFNKEQTKELVPKLTITLLTTDRKVLQLKDVFQPEDLVEIEDFLSQDHRTAANQAPQALSITEWKIPDAASIHPIILEDDDKIEIVNNKIQILHTTRFHTNVLPPYKKTN
jgi:hypothetical protein